MKALLLAFWGMFLLIHDAMATSKLEVIAMEYPPFTGQSLDGYGINFILMQDYASQHFKVNIAPLFVPPARAGRLLLGEKHCLSFYPPKEGNGNWSFVPLADEVVRLGLIRKRQPAQFEWQSLTELSGKNLAILRTKGQSPWHAQFEQAGINLVFTESVEQGLKMLVRDRVDMVFGDSFSLEHAAISPSTREQLQLSRNAIQEAQVGFFYHQRCKEQLFR